MHLGLLIIVYQELQIVIHQEQQIIMHQELQLISFQCKFYLTSGGGELIQNLQTSLQYVAADQIMYELQ